MVCSFLAKNLTFYEQLPLKFYNRTDISGGLFYIFDSFFFLLLVDGHAYDQCPQSIETMKKALKKAEDGVRDVCNKVKNFIEPECFVLPCNFLIYSAIITGCLF